MVLIFCFLISSVCFLPILFEGGYNRGYFKKNTKSWTYFFYGLAPTIFLAMLPFSLMQSAFTFMIAFVAMYTISVLAATSIKSERLSKQ